MEEFYYVTTPIYYVNDVPHIGHAYTTVAADILARFNRLMGRSVFFLTGTDEHGQKVLKAASDAGITPKDHTDKLCENFKKLWTKLDITNNAFIRTTDAGHKEIVQGLLQRLFDKGEIVKRRYEGWYCTHDERFWTDKDVKDGNCPDCGRAVETIEEENYFFLMSKYHDALVRHIKDNPGYIMPESRKNEVLGFLRSNALGDLCISRPKERLSWGVALPFDTNYVTYVWFDALINYYSATQYLSGDKKDFWPASVHIVGKDILTTHAVFWSAMLMALDMPLPKRLFAHGWWTMEGRKMSKSLGNVVDPFEMIERYGADALRYFIFREVTFGLDGDFSEAALIGRVNKDLANDLGNLVSRSIAMLNKYFNGSVPASDAIETELKDLAEGVVTKLEGHLDNLAFQKALDEIWAVITYLNKYIDTNKPWALAKSSETEGRLKTVMYSLIEGLRFVSLYLYPFMPHSMEKLYGHLMNSDIGDVSLREAAIWGRLEQEGQIQGMEQLFPRIETEAAQPAPKSKKAEVKVENVIDIIDIADFAKVRLKTAKILSAEAVKGSNKLIRLTVDAGEERQVVAGIGKHYTPEELVGKTVVIVANLKPAKLMGVESQGMVLAASTAEGALALITVDKEIPAGALVK
ncbi:MAG: methionine--tRNA ligase [Candidatus Magnetominusculus sp. LBB02]|nr:methionine--tRNA ligase [Candidatus Magnetominusculus sp. LBB02]